MSARQHGGTREVERVWLRGGVKETRQGGAIVIGICTGSGDLNVCANVLWHCQHCVVAGECLRVDLNAIRVDLCVFLCDHVCVI